MSPDSSSRLESTASVRSARPATSSVISLLLPWVMVVTWRSSSFRAPASDSLSSRTEMSFKSVMSMGVTVRSTGMDPTSSRVCAVSWPATRFTERLPSRVWMTTSARESAGISTPSSTARSMTTRPCSMWMPLTVPASSPATVTWSPLAMPPASVNTAWTG
jgi:hypothetical protein